MGEGGERDIMASKPIMMKAGHDLLLRKQGRAKGGKVTKILFLLYMMYWIPRVDSKDNTHDKFKVGGWQV